MSLILEVISGEVIEPPWMHNDMHLMMKTILKWQMTDVKET